MGKFLALLTVLAGLAVGAALYAFYYGAMPAVPGVSPHKDDAWLDQLYSHNPREAEHASNKVAELGIAALPVVIGTLQDPAAGFDRRKAALKACAILGTLAAPAIPDAAAELQDRELTEEAALALSFMGPAAFAPLRQALRSDDATVRREALRSIGKLHGRAALETGTVLPLLLEGLGDADAAVRGVAATYIGILHEDPERSVPPLTAALDDAAIEVRRAAATALGSFGEAAAAAVPALKNATRDPDEDLAREAGRSLIKIAGPGDSRR